MKCHPVWILPLLFALTQPISQKCQSTTSPQATLSSCPINSYCNENDFCQCQPGWVLSCTTPSILLLEQKTDVQLSQEPIYFTIVPQTTDSIYVYRFQICIIDNKDPIGLQLSLYADQGKQTQLNSSNFIGQQWLATKGSECWPLYSPYMEFGYQENGLNQQMILKVNFININTYGNLWKNSSSFNQQGTNSQKVKLKLSVMEIFVLKIDTIWIIVILFMLVLFMSFLGGILFCLRAIRRNRPFPHQANFFTDNNLDHFNQLLPITKLSSNDIRITETCSICLLQFMTNDQIRETFCGHVFHHECLDIWCKKNLTCPVCRSSLQKGNLQANKDLEINLTQIFSDNNGERVGDSVLLPQTNSNMRKKLINRQ